MKKVLNEDNQIHNFISSSGSGTVISYGSGSDFLTSYGSGSGSGSTSKKVTVPTVPVPVPQHWYYTTYEIEICVQKSISNLLVVTFRSSRESPGFSSTYYIVQIVHPFSKCKHASPRMSCISASCWSYKSCVTTDDVPGWPTPGGHRTYNRITEAELLFCISVSC